jgi:hypothetical protein
VKRRRFRRAAAIVPASVQLREKEKKRKEKARKEKKRKESLNLLLLSLVAFVRFLMFGA